MHWSCVTHNGPRGKYCLWPCTIFSVLTSIFSMYLFLSSFFPSNTIHIYFQILFIFITQFLGDSVGPLILFGLACIIFYLRYQQRGRQSSLLAKADLLRNSQQQLLRSGRSGRGMGSMGSMGSMSMGRRGGSSNNSNRSFAGGAGGVSRFGGDGSLGSGNSIRYRGGGGNGNGRKRGTENTISSNPINGTVEISTNKPKKKERRIYTGRRRKRQQRKTADSSEESVLVPPKDDIQAVSVDTTSE
jgi:hypothetical protein